MGKTHLYRFWVLRLAIKACVLTICVADFYMLFCRTVPSWVCHIFACMGGCLGCFSKPPLIITAEEPSNGLKHRGVKKPSFTEDFWSTSTGDMDNSAIQSQRSISSISTSNLTLDPHFSSGSKPTEFVNHGLLLWNQTRQQWIGNKGSYNHTQAREPRLSCNATYESLLGTSKPFPQRIRLPEMVDFLVDVWEQEGLYD